jgi:hypothetical protein
VSAISTAELKALLEPIIVRSSMGGVHVAVVVTTEGHTLSIQHEGGGIERSR